jgi:hypothetical protein
MAPDPVHAGSFRLHAHLTQARPKQSKETVMVSVLSIPKVYLEIQRSPCNSPIDNVSTIQLCIEIRSGYGQQVYYRLREICIRLEVS